MLIDNGNKLAPKDNHNLKNIKQYHIGIKMDERFADIIQLIKQSRSNAIRAVNMELISLYWNIGEYISKKIEQSEWGASVVTELSNYIQIYEPEIKGFSDKNIWRMKQF